VVNHSWCNTIWIVEDVVCCDSDDSGALLRERRITTAVMIDLIPTGTAVHFDDQIRCWAAEVGDVRGQRMLATKAGVGVDAGTEALPGKNLG